MGFERVWHRWYPEGTPAAVAIEKTSMPDALAQAAAEFPDNIAYIYMGKTITYRALNRMADIFANALRDLGVAKSDRVGMLLPNIPQVLIANFASYKLGAVTVMNNPLYSERELLHQLNDSQTTTLVTLDLLLPRVLKLQKETRVKNIITCHINDYLPFPAKHLFPLVKKEMYRRDTPQEGVYPFMQLMRRYPDTPVRSQAAWNDTAALLYTGGTTGVSKGAVQTHANLSASVQIFSAWFPDLKRGAPERIMGIYPIFHTAGYQVTQNLVVWNAWTGVLVPKPEPVVITRMLKKFKPTFMPGVPTIYVGLMAHKPFRQSDLSHIKGYFGGAAPLAEDTLNSLQELHGAIIHDVYGATENTAFATCTPWQGKVKIGTVGIPLPNTDLKIVDLVTGETITEPNRDGEICIRGPQVMAGYHNRLDETREVLIDGWLHMGDVGRMDEDGYLTIVDRKKDMILAGGFNIYPKEVDEILMGHEKIFEACSFGVPDAYRGETLKAYIVPLPGEKPTAEEIMAYCKNLLSAYKVPTEIMLVEELPKTAVGKIRRKAAREMYLEQIQSQQETGSG